MSRNIKLHSLHFLFRIFSFLADKSGGWKLFVKPKLIIGSLILGLGFTACHNKSGDNSKETMCYVEITEFKKIESKAIDTLNTGMKNKTSKKDISSFHSRNKIISKKETTDNANNDSLPSEIVYNNKIKTKIIATCYEVVDVPNDPTDSNSIYEVAEQMPEYPGGIDSLFKYIYSELTYPSNEAEVQGRVICRFVVEKDGSLKQINVVRSLEKSYDKEVVRLIQNMPKWIPGKQNGKVVRVWVMLPVNFKLQ